MGEYSHGDTTLREDVNLPLVCIGDSLRNCGLGGGGILAMRDATELANLLEAAGAFDATGSVNMEPLRASQDMMLKRKVEHMKGKDSTVRKVFTTRDGTDPNLHLKDFVPNLFARVPLRLFLYFVSFVFKRWYQWDRFWGQAGSTRSSPVYPKV